MPRLPEFAPNITAVFPRSPQEEEAIREHHREEYDAGLDRVGPEWEDDENEDIDMSAMVHAAGMGAVGILGDA